MSNEPITGAFHDALTGETIVRELTAEEIESFPQFIEIEPTDETPSASLPTELEAPTTPE
jgi:hypothetical protein